MEEQEIKKEPTTLDDYKQLLLDAANDKSFTKLLYEIGDKDLISSEQYEDLKLAIKNNRYRSLKDKRELLMNKLGLDNEVKENKTEVVMDKVEEAKKYPESEEYKGMSTKYVHFCRQYEINPDDYDAALDTIDDCIGMFGDPEGLYEELREYIVNDLMQATYISSNNDNTESTFSTTNVTVFQMKDDDSLHGRRFLGLKYNQDLNLNMYNEVAHFNMDVEVNNVNNALEEIFSYGNSQDWHDQFPNARSISVSDLIKLDNNYYFVESMGFEDVTDMLETKTESKVTEEKVETEDVTVTIQRRIDAIKRLMNKYKELGVQDKVNELEQKLKEAETELWNYSNPDKPMKFVETRVNKYLDTEILKESKLVEYEQLDVDSPEEIDDETPVEAEVEDEETIDPDKTTLDYIQDRIGQQITVGELNSILQSLFARYNQVFLLSSDLYNMDLEDTQELVVNDDGDMYVINYDIVDMDDGIIEITDANIE